MIPEGFIEELSRLTLLRGAAQYVQATDPVGLPELREEIARRASRDGSKVTPDMVMITNGVMQAITLLAQHYMEKRPEVICETPCFQGIPNSFAAMGHWVETVRRDEKGPMIEQLERFSSQASRLLYLCPYAHNPMGTNLRPERSAYLVEWAQKTGGVLVVDEIFRELQFNGADQPSMLRDLGSEQTIVVNSLSKSVMSGLRIGWIITSPRRIQELAQLKKLMDCSAPTFMQGMALSLFSSGLFDTHSQEMAERYQRRMNTMIKSLKKMMPAGVRWSQPDGGFSILLELPTGYSSVALLFNAIDMGVSFLPGPLFDIDQRYVNGLRLSTAWTDEHQIKEGVELLASSIEKFLAMPPCDTGLSGIGGFQ
jgi:DNA-binding transcriptional MocR family regulator